MGSVRRFYAEKKKGLDLEAQALKKELEKNLGITGLSGLRVLNRYDIEGVDDSVPDSALHTVFADSRCDIIHTALPDFSGSILAAEPLPGQYDQRADFCSKCISLITLKENPLVRTAKIYLFCGGLSGGHLQKITDYIINPVETRVASVDMPSTLRDEYPAPSDVEILDGFTALGPAGLNAFKNERSFAMDAADLAFLQEYFRDTEKRDPTITEVRILDTYWSDHCRHTTFLTRINKVEIEDAAVRDAYAQYLESRRVSGRGEDKPVTLMDIATVGARRLYIEGKLPDLDLSEEVNACSVRVKADIDGEKRHWLLMFKNETHNHPTEIEPFGGASTCLGGAIRDPLSGRAFVYQAMRVTGSADPTAPCESTLRGKLWQRKITTAAAEGYSSYGNQIGLASGYLREIYHPGYMAKRMEAGALVAAAPEENVVRETPVPGDLILLIGGRTGRDGCGGATGSSKSHTEESLECCGAEVQKGNAAEERKIQRLFRNPKASRLIKRCNDFGAGGVSVAIGELADGLLINLDAVTVKYGGLDGTELAISESQERMAVVVAPENLKAFSALALEENLEASVVAEVTKTPRLTMKWRGKVVADISRAFLNSSGTPKTTDVRVLKGDFYKPSIPGGKTPSDRLIAHLSSLNVCSQRGIAERFDSTAGGAAIFMPYGGRDQLSPIQCMAAKLPVLDGYTDTCSLMSYGFSPEVLEKNPFFGAADAVVESIAKLVAAGCGISRIWLSFQEYFESNKNDPVRWGKPFAALLGALSAQLGLGIASIGGKDSMSGSFEDLNVPPTLISFAVGIGNAKTLISPQYKHAGSRVELFRPQKNADGTPDYTSLRKLFENINALIGKGVILSCRALGTGGIAEAAVSMALGNGQGCALDCSEEELYAYHCGGFIAECAHDAGGELIGKTLAEPVFRAAGADIALTKLSDAMEAALEPVFPTRAGAPDTSAPAVTFEKREYPAPAICAAVPRVLIPVLPGTTCEYDMARKFNAAGAKCAELIVRTLSPALLRESISRTADALGQSQILVLPDAFLPGDKPEGAGRFTAVYFGNPVLRDALEGFMERGGLVLGIGSGFNALLSLGLLPGGRIAKPDEHAPALAANLIGRHQSRMVTTRVASVKSPWLSRCHAGQLHTLPFSHGQGRFIADEALFQALAANGQIATQYAGHDGAPSMDIRFNPGGSMWAVEGLFSPDGRIFGKMANSERADNGLLLNIPGDKSQDIFGAGVDYFKL